MAAIQLNKFPVKRGANQLVSDTTFDCTGDDETGAINVNITGVTLANIDAGSNGVAGDVDIYPATALSGKLRIAAADSVGDTTTTLVNASQAAARTYTIPDAGDDASFVMTKGANATGTFTAATITTLTSTTANITTANAPTVNATNIDAGAAAVKGSVDIFAGGTKGKLILSATENTGDTTTTLTNALQADTRIYTIPDAGESTTFLMAKGTSATMPTVTAGTITTLTSPTIIGNALDLGLAAGGTAGSLDIFSATGSKGKLAISATANTGDSITSITNAAQGGAYTYTIPDAGENASFVMTKGTVTVSTLTAGKATNIVGGAGGVIPYQSAADTTGLLANGTAGQILTSQGGTAAPKWSDPTLNGCVVIKASLGSPAVSVTTAVAAAQAVGGAANLTLNGTLTTGNVATFLTARNVQAVSTGAGDTDQTLHITGTNILGVAMTETITLNGVAIVYGKKAFKTITQIAVSKATAGDVSVGNSTALGLPFKLTARSDLQATWYNNVQEATLPTVALGDGTGVGATTGDVRGSVILNSALNGSPVEVYMAVYPGTTIGLYGLAEFAG